ncbi:MAG TPA: META domain-containing protein [Vicinamibacterales bacterium]|nr:META domain-containing protein [Vicinamibacterales bacterium]
MSRILYRARLVLVASIVTAGCSSEQPPRQSADILAEVLAEAGNRNAVASSPDSSMVTLPATFVGVLPCDDCAGTRYHVNLLRDRSYVLRQTRLGPDDSTIDDYGAWTLGVDRRTLTLDSESRTKRLFRIVDDRTLRPLDDLGRDVSADAPRGLVRSPAFETLDGIVKRPVAADARLSLDGTPWTLTHLGSEPVAPVDAPTIMPFLEVRPATGQFSGSDGCNRLVGTYAQNGPAISFNIGVVTRISCPEGGEVSQAFSTALTATRSWRIQGRQLELVGEAGRIVARLAPRP